jgi:ribonuclease HII
MSNFLGIDENGYGPIMGPLVITGTCANKNVKKGWPQDIKDSKKIFVRDKKSYKTIEEISLALFFLLYGYFPENPEEYIEKFSSFKCPYSFKNNICTENIPQSFLWSIKSDTYKTIDILDRFFKKNSINIIDIKSVILCPFEFNNLCTSKVKKDLINFLQFEKIIKYFSDKSSTISILAGKIGGRNKYSQFLEETFPFWEYQVIQEKKEKSSYIFKNKDKKVNINFLKNVENQSFPACLSGIIGKYIREIIMTSINISLENKEFVSGYREKKTKKLLKYILKQDYYKNIDINCIIRKK